MNEQHVAQELAAVHGPFENLISAESNGDATTGQFFNGGIVYDYEITADEVAYRENRADSIYIADYYRALLEEEGFRSDSTNPYEYWKGVTQTNLDAVKPNCQNGTTPCGNRCLPRGQECRQGRMKGGLKKALVAGAAVAGAAAVAGGVAALKRKKKTSQTPSSEAKTKTEAQAKTTAKRTINEVLKEVDTPQRNKAVEELLKEVSSEERRQIKQEIRSQRIKTNEEEYQERRKKAAERKAQKEREYQERQQKRRQQKRGDSVPAVLYPVRWY